MNEQSSGNATDHAIDITIGAIRLAINNLLCQSGMPYMNMSVDAIAAAAAAELKKGKDEVTAYVKLVWNYEEKNCLKYSLEEAIKWFTDNKPEQATAGCLLKQEPDDKYSPYKLHHCYLGKDEVPLLDGQHPHRIVHTGILSEDLEKSFGGKEMLILK